MSKREDKRRGDDEEEDDDDISGSDGGSEESGSDEEMSESESDSERKPSGTAGSGKSSGAGGKSGSERALMNQPFDEALDLSESDSGSVSEGLDSPKKASKQLKNLPFDEALELSGSVQDLESPQKPAATAPAMRKEPAPVSSSAAAKATPVAARSAAGAGAKTIASAVPGGNEVKNNPFDEEVDLSDSGDSIDTNGQPSPDRSSLKAKSAAAASASSTAAKPTATPAAAAATAKSTPAAAATPTTQPERKAPAPTKHESESSSEESGSEDEDDDEEDEDDDGDEAPAPSSAAGGAAASSSAGSSNATQSAILANAGSYKESDFAHLKVSSEVRELFQYIGRFKSQEIELETRLKCFIPEFIPAVGDMDAFVKIPRPDQELDNLGLKMLDEPSLAQSDATVLDLQLRATSKKKHGDIVVRSIENAEKVPKEIDKWVKSIADLHRTKPPPQVHYSKAMPDIESLMQVWPDAFEELLSTTPLPSAAMDMTLEQYTRVICALLDIPVHKNVFESLHVLFTLYLEFRSNQHFMNYDEQQITMTSESSSSRGTTAQALAFGDDYSARK